MDAAIAKMRNAEGHLISGRAKTGALAPGTSYRVLGITAVAVPASAPIRDVRQTPC